MPKHISISPGRIVLCSFLTLIILGTGLLMLPCTQIKATSLLDCFFTATSAVCTTGLLVVPLENFSRYGHIVILLLIQLGALGLITLSVFFLSLFSTLGISTRSMTSEAMELTSGNSPAKLAIFTIYFTLAVECIGFFASLCTIFPAAASWHEAMWQALSHAISSFCNAGILFVPLPQGTEMSMSNVLLLVVTGSLVFVGGLGFIVWRDVFNYIQSRRDQRRPHLLLHTRIVLSSTAIIIGALTILVFFLEYAQQVTVATLGQSCIAALFNAICFRGPGFTTIAMTAIQPATMLLIMIASFIGSSPGSTGSGIKVTTAALLVATIRATLFRNAAISSSGRTIPNDQIFKALAIVTLSIAWISIIAFFLFITEHTEDLFGILFEAVSSFTNLGLTRDTTSHLSSLGKSIVIISMIVGRIGSLTILLALKKQSRNPELYYPEERIIMG